MAISSIANATLLRDFGETGSIEYALHRYDSLLLTGHLACPSFETVFSFEREIGVRMQTLGKRLRSINGDSCRRLIAKMRKRNAKAQSRKRIFCSSLDQSG